MSIYRGPAPVATATGGGPATAGGTSGGKFPPGVPKSPAKVGQAQLSQIPAKLSTPSQRTGLSFSVGASPAPVGTEGNNTPPISLPKRPITAFGSPQRPEAAVPKMAPAPAPAKSNIGSAASASTTFQLPTSNQLPKPPAPTPAALKTPAPGASSQQAVPALNGAAKQPPQSGFPKQTVLNSSGAAKVPPAAVPKQSSVPTLPQRHGSQGAIDAASQKSGSAPAISVPNQGTVQPQNESQPANGGFYKRPAIFSTPPRLETGAVSTQIPPQVPPKPVASPVSNSPNSRPPNSRLSTSGGPVVPTVEPPSRPLNVRLSTSGGPVVPAGIATPASVSPANAAVPELAPKPVQPRPLASSNNLPPKAASSTPSQTGAMPKMSSSTDLPAKPVASALPTRPMQKSFSTPDGMNATSPVPIPAKAASAAPSSPRPVAGSPKQGARPTTTVVTPASLHAAGIGSASPPVPRISSMALSRSIDTLPVGGQASINRAPQVQVSPRNMGVGLGEAVGDNASSLDYLSKSPSAPTVNSSFASALGRSAQIGNALTRASDQVPVIVTPSEDDSRLASNLMASSVAGLAATASPTIAEPHRAMQTAAAAYRLNPALRPRSGAKPLVRPPMPKNTYRFHKFLSRMNAESERQPRPLRELEIEDAPDFEEPMVETLMMETLSPLSEVAQQRTRLDSERPPVMDFLSDSDDETDDVADDQNEEPLDAWIEVIADDGFIFYHNTMSSRSTWDTPDGFVPAPSGPQRPDSVAYPSDVPMRSSTAISRPSAAAYPAEQPEEEDDDNYGPSVFPDIALSFQKHFSQKNLIVNRKIERVIDPQDSVVRNVLPQPQGVVDSDAETAEDYEDEEESGVESEDLTSSLVSTSASDMEGTFGSDSLTPAKVYVVEEIVDVGKPIQPQPIREINLPKPKAFIPLSEYMALQASSSADQPASNPLSVSASINDPDLERLKLLQVGFMGFPGQLAKPGRKLLREGDLTKSPRKLTGRWKLHAVFLFNDMIVIAMRTGLNRFKVKLAVPLSECVLKVPGRRGASSFDLLTPIEKLCLMAKSLEECSVWNQAIADATNALFP